MPLLETGFYMLRGLGCWGGDELAEVVERHRSGDEVSQRRGEVLSARLIVQECLRSFLRLL